MSKGSREATESTVGAALRMGAAERHSPNSFFSIFFKIPLAKSTFIAYTRK